MWSCYFWCETDLISNLKFVELHRRFDDSFKIMAVGLSVVRGSVAEVAKELDIGPSLLSKRCRNLIIMRIKFSLIILKLALGNRS